VQGGVLELVRDPSPTELCQLWVEISNSPLENSPLGLWPIDWLLSAFVANW
jgi:hypothetical protein